MSLLQAWGQPNDPSHAVEVLETGKLYLLDTSWKSIASKHRFNVVKIMFLSFLLGHMWFPDDQHADSSS